MKKYMVCVDGSPEAHEAYNMAVKMMNREQDQLHVVHLVSLITTASVSAGAVFVQFEQSNKHLQDLGQLKVQPYIEYCKEDQIKHAFIHVVSGYNGPQDICEFAREKGIDVCFVGRRGISGLQRVVSGSISWYLLQHLACNVLVVKHRASSSQEGLK